MKSFRKLTFHQIIEFHKLGLIYLGRDDKQRHTFKMKHGSKLKLYSNNKWRAYSDFGYGEDDFGDFGTGSQGGEMDIRGVNLTKGFINKLNATLNAEALDERYASPYGVVRSGFLLMCDVERAGKRQGFKCGDKFFGNTIDGMLGGGG